MFEVGTVLCTWKVDTGRVFTFHRIFTPVSFLAQAACVRWHGTKCPLLTVFFLFFSRHYFSPRRSYCRVPKCYVGFKKIIYGIKKLRDPLPPGGRFFMIFFRKNEMARKLIRKFFKFFAFPPPRHFPRKFSASVEGGLSASVRRPGSEGPPRR